MALTVCPLSNLRLRACATCGEHPLRRMLDKGLFVTVNSDDPAYFGGYVNENCSAIRRASVCQRRDARVAAMASLPSFPWRRGGEREEKRRWQRSTGRWREVAAIRPPASQRRQPLLAWVGS